MGFFSNVRQHGSGIEKYKKIWFVPGKSKILEKNKIIGNSLISEPAFKSNKFGIPNDKGSMNKKSGVVISVAIFLLSFLIIALAILFVKAHIKRRGKSSKRRKGRKSKHNIVYDGEDSDTMVSDEEACLDKKYYPHQMGGKHETSGLSGHNNNESRKSLIRHSSLISGSSKGYRSTLNTGNKSKKSQGETLEGQGSNKGKKIKIDWYKFRKPDIHNKNMDYRNASWTGRHSVSNERNTDEKHNIDVPDNKHNKGKTKSVRSLNAIDDKIPTTPETLPSIPIFTRIGGLILSTGYGVGNGGSYLQQFFPAYSRGTSIYLEKSDKNSETTRDSNKAPFPSGSPGERDKSRSPSNRTLPSPRHSTNESSILAKALLPKHFHRHLQGLQNQSHQDGKDNSSHSHSQEEMLLSRRTENGTSPSQPSSPHSKPSPGGNTTKYLATPTSQQAKALNESSRLSDLYNSGAGEEEDQINLGTIHFGISYDFQNQNLIVKILQAKTLPAKDITGTSDPYVKLFLLPDRKSKMETRVKKRCLNPIWNETFLYEGFPYHKLQNRILNLQVFDYDRFSKDDPIGEIFLPLNEVDLSQFPHYWKKLIPMDKSSKTGEILLTITYIPGPGKLVVEIIKCKNLKPTDVIGSSDPYIKLWLMENGKKTEKQKTQIKFNNLNPVFSESFTFMVPTEKIRSTSLLVSALDYDRFTRNDTIGSFLLSSRSSPMEMKHWKDMLLNPGKPITQWHFLRT